VRCFASFQSEEVASAAFMPQTELVFAAAGNKVYSFDLRKPEVIFRTFEKEFAYNKEDINSIAVSSRFLTACDDSGEVQVVDLHSNTLFKTLRKHSNICSSICFRSERRPCEVISGGLDSLLIHWDFSSGRPLHSHNLAIASSSPQVFNPPFVHSVDMSANGNVVAGGLGDNNILIYDLVNRSPAALLEDGHSNSVSQARFAAFAPFTHLVSGGNDKFILIWNIRQALGEIQNKTKKKKCANRQKVKSNIEASKPKQYFLEQRINHGSKVNWLCTAAEGSSLGNLFVADQTSIITAYHIIP